MNVNKLTCSVVLICDRVNSRDGISILSDNLEFTSNTYFSAISSALEKAANKFIIMNP